MSPSRDVRKTITALFCDVVDSTGLAGSMDPESYRKVMARFFEEMAAVIEHHGGTLEKFVGDAVKATFGVPAAHEDDALRAIKAAVEMREVLISLNKELESQWGIVIAARTGINTGEVVAGESVAGQPLVLGDAMNVAARLEQAAKPSEILIGKETYLLVRDAVEAEPFQPLVVKGKTEPVTAYRLVDVIPGASPVARRLDLPMVGRTEQLDVVLNAFDKAARSSCCEFVTVFGSPGIGKSRLIVATAERLADDARVIASHCHSYEEGSTFRPMVEIIEKAASVSVADGVEDAQEKLAVLLQNEERSNLITDRIIDLLGLIERETDVRESFWAVRRLLETVSRNRPLVIIVEDIHWAGPMVLDLIEHVVEWTQDVPLLVVCTTRPDLLDDRSDWGRGHPTVFLEPLGQPDSELLLHELLTVDIPNQDRARLLDLSGGNPLFIEQMASMVTEDGQEGFSATAVPPSIRALLTARLDRLSPKERSVIEIASVVGDEFPRSFVQELSGGLGSDLDHLLRGLIRRDLLRPQRWDRPEEETFRFTHALVREAVYDATTKESRASLHERLANCLLRTADPRSSEQEEIVGYHLEQAFRHLGELRPVDEAACELGARAAAYLADAGRRALARHDGLAAADLFRRALNLLPDGAPEKIRISIDLSDALMVSSHEKPFYERAANELEEALKAARSLKDKQLEARALTMRGYSRLILDEEKARVLATRDAKQAIDILTHLQDPSALGMAWNLLAYVHIDAGEMSAAQHACERAFQNLEQAENPTDEGWTRTWMFYSKYHGPASVDDAIAWGDQQIDWAVKTGSRIMELSTLRIVGYLHAMAGRFDKARALVGRSRSIATDLGSAGAEADGAWYSARIELLAGDPRAAEQVLRHAFDIFAAVGDFKPHRDLSNTACYLARALYERGDYPAAESFAEVAREKAYRYDPQLQPGWRRVKAKLLARRREVDAAEKLAREAVAFLSGTDMINDRADALLDLADVLALVDRPADASHAAQEALGLYEAKGNLVSARKARRYLEESSRPLAR